MFLSYCVLLVLELVELVRKGVYVQIWYNKHAAIRMKRGWESLDVFEVTIRKILLVPILMFVPSLKYLHILLHFNMMSLPTGTERMNGLGIVGQRGL